MVESVAVVISSVAALVAACATVWLAVLASGWRRQSLTTLKATHRFEACRDLLREVEQVRDAIREAANLYPGQSSAGAKEILGRVNERWQAFEIQCTVAIVLDIDASRVHAVLEPHHTAVQGLLSLTASHTPIPDDKHFDFEAFDTAYARARTCVQRLFWEITA